MKTRLKFKPVIPLCLAVLCLVLSLLGLPAWADTPTASTKPGVVTFAFSNGVTQDTEIITWPDKSYSLPLRATLDLYGIPAQISGADKRALFVDPVGNKRVELDWGSQTVKINDQVQPAMAHPMVYVANGLLLQDELYVDKAFLESLLSTTFHFDTDATTLSLSTKRTMKAARLSSGSVSQSDTYSAEIDESVVNNPTLYRAPVEKIYIHNTNNTNYQVANQPNGLNYQLMSSSTNSLINTPTIGILGSLWNMDYFLKPTFIRYNGRSNLSDLQWGIQHKGKKRFIGLGSQEAGLMPLVCPTLPVWGLKIASNNALTPSILNQAQFQHTGKTKRNHTYTVKVNDRTIQTVTAQDDDYSFEPVTLDPQTINNVKVLEKDEENQETLLYATQIARFEGLLPQGHTAYSAFAGRAPLQFYPVLPNQNVPLLMPQSDKWMAGGRFFYGLTDRLTMGVATAADTVFGRARSYYASFNPLSPDLTGFNSYQRDSNFFKGENAGVSLRYQITNHWLLTSDSGVSTLTILPGSLLTEPNPHQDGLGSKLQLAHQSTNLNTYVNVFHYDPYYYTPSTSIFGNALYDKNGFGAGFNGALTRFSNLAYKFDYTLYQTNLAHLISGGDINANRYEWSLSKPIGAKSAIFVTGNIVNGINTQRQFLQHAYDATYRTQIFPHGISGEVHVGQYFTNTLFLPTSPFSIGGQIVQTRYLNNSVDTSLNFPIKKLRNKKFQDVKFKVGNHISTFYDAAIFDLSFRYKNWSMEPVVQKSYGDTIQTQNSMGAKLGYHFKSGCVLSFYFFHNTNTFSGAIPGIPRSNISTNQVYLDFTTVLGLLANRLKGLGPNGENMGILIGTVYVDSNHNGKRDRGEPGVPNVQLVLDKQTNLHTDAKGNYTITNLPVGYHKLEVIPDNLPLTLNADVTQYKIKISDARTYKYNLALTAEGGKLSGRINLKDIKGKPISPKGLILVLTNPQGETINYTTVDEDGQYHFNNIISGQYKIDLEAKTRDSGRYKILSTPSNVTLPPGKDFNQITEIKNLDFDILVL